MAEILLVPAIDIRGGKCVRLFQGDPDRQTTYPISPAEVAARFEADGVRRIHIVDLDGAFDGTIANWAAIAAVRKACGLELEFGGGIRTMTDLSRLSDSGVLRFCLGSSVVQNPHFFETALSVYGGRIVVGVDMRGDKLALKGWKDLRTIDLFDFLSDLEKKGVGEITFTDVARDGALTGPNLDRVKQILSRSKLGLTVAGGVGSVDDIRNIKNLKNSRIRAIILGKAFYEGKIDLKTALSVLKDGN
jgi:phosphoribosylformimino-5-aminoimidazole carboxamide ribotide isomerase